jgi:FADH2 O2-dependent halogenase
MSEDEVDMVVAGSGFAGTLMALVLHNSGLKVCLVEKGKHPRFAIGESSTPVADLLLRQLASEYNLPWLAGFSRYGSWQEIHPEIVCGLKRGFSFFKHRPGEEFTTDGNHINELLVAASADDIQSDTNWLRADVDAFLVSKAIEAGITYLDETSIESAEWNDDSWKLAGSNSGNAINLKAGFIIDATGSGALAENLFGVRSSPDGFLTHSIAVFSHFDDVPRWRAWLEEQGVPTAAYPYDPDHSALHQVLDEGWMWMLRFNDRRTSLGFVLDISERSYAETTAARIWDSLLIKYPSVGEFLGGLTFSDVPGSLLKSSRLQRRLAHCFGQGWVALPHSIGFVDPLFSPGIAHSLSGVQKIARLVKECFLDKNTFYEGLKEYEQDVLKEIHRIDKLIAGCYRTMRCFPMFNAWSMLYFVATIAHEQRLINGEKSGCFLSADNEYVLEIVDTSYVEMEGIMEQAIISTEDTERFTQSIRQRIAPLNTARLLDSSLKNMYTHTAARI